MERKFLKDNDESVVPEGHYAAAISHFLRAARIPQDTFNANKNMHSRLGKAAMAAAEKAQRCGMLPEELHDLIGRWYTKIAITAKDEDELCDRLYETVSLWAGVGENRQGVACAGANPAVPPACGVSRGRRAIDPVQRPIEFRARREVPGFRSR